MAKILHVLRHFIDTLYYYILHCAILHCAVAMMYVTIFLMEIDYSYYQSNCNDNRI